MSCWPAQSDEEGGIMILANFSEFPVRPYNFMSYGPSYTQNDRPEDDKSYVLEITQWWARS
jgi:hypothetical protein